jgi:hypothetical protein
MHLVGYLYEVYLQTSALFCWVSGTRILSLAHLQAVRTPPGEALLPAGT